MATRGQSSEKIRKKDALGEAEAKLAALSLEPQRPLVVENAAAGTLGKPFPVQTNVFGVKVKRSVAIWRYDIVIFAEIKGKKTVFFTKKGRDDYIVTSRNYKCKLVFDTVLRTYQKFFGDPSMLWYDGQSVLFSGTNLFAVVDEPSKKFHVSGKDCCDDSLMVFETITFDIAPVAEDYCISVTEKSMVDSMCHLDLSQNDRTIAQFMEVVFNQQAVMNPREHGVFENGKTYLSQPWLYGFTERECPQVGDGKRLYPGTQKSVYIIEGKRGRGFCSPALVIDAKKAAFHEHMSLIEKAKMIVNDDFSRKIPDVALDKLNAGLKGLFFYTKHTGSEMDHQIAAVVSYTASEATFALPDGTRVSVLQYFVDRYNIHLRYPNAPLVKVRGRDQNYPMELGWIKPMQRVTISQQTPDQSHKTTRNCAIPPGERQDDIVKGANALKLLGSDGNAFVESAGLYIDSVPMEIPGRLLPPPKIRYRDSVTVVRDGKWRTPRGHFFIPARCEVWAIYAVLLKHEISHFSKELLWDFGKAFFSEASNRGINLPEPAEVEVTSGESELENRLKNAADHSCAFCLIVSSDSITSVHKKIKLLERELEMVTQEVRLSSVRKVVKQKHVVTLENIVMKANLKLGGLNYVIDLNDMGAGEGVKNWIRPGRLFLGVSISHSPRTSNYDSDKGTPSVVGYAANFKENPFDFVGDYLFQSSGREETLTTLSDIASNIIPKFAEYHGGKYPRDLVIYRSGLSEGSFGTVLTHEIPLLRGTLSTLGARNIKIVFIVVQKKHNVRLMLTSIDRSRKQIDQNIPPGIVIDSRLTHPNFKEFYLNSHLTLQGSACTPRYTVLVDDLNLSMNELEGMTHVLTYDHQIVNVSTSLPTPLYVANCYAERGRNNYDAYLICSCSTSSESGASVDYGRLASRLSYSDTKLGNIRVNA